MEHVGTQQFAHLNTTAKELPPEAPVSHDCVELPVEESLADPAQTERSVLEPGPATGGEYGGTPSPVYGPE